MTKEEVQWVYSLLLDPDLISEEIKIAGRMSKLGVLVFAHMVEMGIAEKKNGKSAGFFSHLPEAVLDELQAMAKEYVVQAKVAHKHENLNRLQQEN